MSENIDMELEDVPLQKEVETPKDTFTSGRKFAELATDLTDEEIQKAFIVINRVRSKYMGLANTPDNLENLSDEMETCLADIGILAKLDKTPCAIGEAPIVEIIGKVHGGSFSEIEFDHEHKEFEVKKAHSQGEYRYGEKSPMNPISKAAKKTQDYRKKLILPNGAKTKS